MVDQDWDKLPRTFWHCQVAFPGRNRDQDRSVVNDLEFGTLRTTVLEPWHAGRPFTISGRLVTDRTKLSEIQICQTPNQEQHYANRHNAEMSASGIWDMATDRRLLPFASGTDYTHLLLFGAVPEGMEAAVPPAQPDIATVLRLCERLTHSARLLSSRRKGKTPYVVEDEYDVQDLLQALLRAYFKYSVQEEPLGKLAGKSGRADVAIEELGLIAEMKYARGPRDQERIVREVSEDIVLYSKWAPLRHLVFVVFNSSDLRDPESLQKLEGDVHVQGAQFRVYVVLC